MHKISVSDIPWIAHSSESFLTWLTDHGGSLSPKSKDAMKSANKWGPNFWYSWVVQCVTYEHLWTDLWQEECFENGIKAFGLLSLEHEGVIQAFVSESGEVQVLVSRAGAEPMSINDFLDGQTLEYRFDPEYADLNWLPVPTVGRILDEYYSI